MLEQQRLFVYRYTAEEAVGDGVPFGLNPALRCGAGYAIPARITAGVKALVSPKEQLLEGESVEERLRETLWPPRAAILNGDRYGTIAPSGRVRAPRGSDPVGLPGCQRRPGGAHYQAGGALGI